MVKRSWNLASIVVSVSTLETPPATYEGLRTPAIEGETYLSWAGFLVLFFHVSEIKMLLIN